MTVWPLPRITFQELSAVEEKRPIALLSTEEAWTVWGSQLNLPVIIQAEPSRYSEDLFDYLADHLPTQAQAVYAVGSGAAIHAGKVIAARNHKPLVIIPTAFDSNDMLTPTAWVEQEDGDQPRRVKIETGSAAQVIVDWAVIESAPVEQRGAAIVDVLAIVTALLDWRYAAQKGKNPKEARFTPWVASVAAGLASQAIKSAPAIGQGGQEALRLLLDLLMISVQLSNQLGHTRAQEGSEHYLAQVLATQADPALSHAERVGPALLLVSALHAQDPAPLREALESAGVRLDQLRAADMRLVINNLAAVVADYAFPYSILNDLDPMSEPVAQALEAAGLVIEEGTWQLTDTQPVLAGSPDGTAPAGPSSASPAAPAASTPAGPSNG